MCASYNPPIEDIPTFNSSLFNQPEQILSQADADKLYLSKTKNDTSTATTTTFNGAMLVKGASEFGINGIGSIVSKAGIQTYDVASPYANFSQYYVSGNSLSYIMNAGATTNSFHNFIAYNNTGLSRSALKVGYTDVSITDGVNLSTRQIISSSTASIAHGIFTNMTTGGVLTIGNTASSNTINGDTNFINRLNFSAASYSFPFASNQNLGYYLKTTGSTISTPTFVTATPTSIVSVTIPIGVWRIDFSVQNVIGVAGAGTISSAQSYISTTSSGAVATAVAFTGSIIRSHVAEVYANNDVQIITGSITYNQTTSGLIYLNIVRSFSTGQYNFTGELGVTRLG